MTKLYRKAPVDIQTDSTQKQPISSNKATSTSDVSKSKFISTNVNGAHLSYGPSLFLIIPIVLLEYT